MVNSNCEIELRGVFNPGCLIGLVKMMLLRYCVLVDDDNYSCGSLFDAEHNRTGSHGLKVDSVVILEKINHEKAGFLCGDSSLCPICLESFQFGDEVSRINSCRHTFHSKCLSIWTANSTTCPCCRQDFKTKCPINREEKNAHSLQPLLRGMKLGDIICSAVSVMFSGFFLPVDVALHYSHEYGLYSWGVNKHAVAR